MSGAEPARTPRITWFDADAGDLDEFVAGIPERTDLEFYPFAQAIERNVLLYSGDRIRDLDRSGQASLMSEWAQALLDGPGLFVIKCAFADNAPVDRATKLFERIIDEERTSGSGGGDHFARPGANDRVWNALQKHCLADPEGYALYFGNVCLALAAYSWLGPNYQFTAQINRVNPGGLAQTPHRDYHLGFMTREDAARWPIHAHLLSPALTLQGAVAHCDMPVESGPTMYLPYSQRYQSGYVAFGQPEFQEYFEMHHVQLPLEKGDAVFFNPALMHGAGSNRSENIYRMANLLQIGSAFGRSIEAINRREMCQVLLAPLAELIASGTLSEAEAEAVVAATAEGYAYPTNLDTDLPAPDSLAPLSLAALMRRALSEGFGDGEFTDMLDRWERRRQP